MDALSSSPVPLHIASDMGWHLIEYLYYAGSALLLGVAALLIISGRRERRAVPDEQRDDARAKRLS